MNAVFTRARGWSYSLIDSFRKQLYSDVTLVVEGRNITVHGSVLVSLSPFFGLLLSAHDKNETTVVMEGYRYSIMTLLVNFLYEGYVSGSHDELVTLLEYAKELKVEGLVSSSQNTKSVRLHLTDTRSAASLELKKLQTIASDSESCSSDDEDISILYENLERDNRIVPDSPQLKAEITCDTASDSKRNEAATVPNSSIHPIKRKILISDVHSLQSSKKPKPHKIAIASSNLSEPGPSSQVTIGEGSTIPTPAKAIKCSVCKQIFSSKYELRIHLTTHADILTCRICDKMFQSQFTLKRHLRKHIEKLDLMIGATADDPEGSPTVLRQVDLSKK